MIEMTGPVSETIRRYAVSWFGPSQINILYTFIIKFISRPFSRRLFMTKTGDCAGVLIVGVLCRRFAHGCRTAVASALWTALPIWSVCGTSSPATMGHPVMSRTNGMTPEENLRPPSTFKWAIIPKSSSPHAEILCAGFTCRTEIG